jgi:hypothetical protein
MLASYELGVNTYVVELVGFHDFVSAIQELAFWAVISEPRPDA